MTGSRPLSSSTPQVQGERFTHTANGRMWRLYGCAKRGCDAINLDYEAFGTREGKSYCLNHIPLRSRLRLWRQERAS